MYSKIFFILFLSFCFSCSEETPHIIKQNHTTKIKTPPIKKLEKKEVVELINNDNVVEKLLAYGKENTETEVFIHTSKGSIKVRLYKDTPLHRANFILLAKKGYLDGCLFSRVVKDFMAQYGGSYDDKQREIQKKIGHYTIPAEMSHHHYHKKGALAAARSYSNNPEKRSSSDEFYFVEGTLYNDISLDKYEDENNYKYSEKQRNYYLKNKGAAHIDGEHTVFGEIIKGYSVVPKLTNVLTDSQDWPNVDIYIDSVTVIR